MNCNKKHHCLLCGILLGLVILLQGCGGGGGGAEASTPGPLAVPLAPSVVPGRWVVMGSSSAYGAGASAGQGWAAQLQSNWQASAVEMRNLAKPGSVTYQGLAVSAVAVPGRPLPDAAHNIDAALALKPSLLLVSYPTNDTALGYSVDETVRNVLAIRAKAQSQDVPVMVLSTQPRAMSAELLQRLDAVNTLLLKEVQDCFVPVHAALAGVNGLLAPAYDSGDGVHPNNAGHALIFQHIHNVLTAGRCVRVAG